MCSCNHPKRVDQDSNTRQVIRLQVDQVGGSDGVFVVWIKGQSNWTETHRTQILRLFFRYYLKKKKQNKRRELNRHVAPPFSPGFLSVSWICKLDHFVVKHEENDKNIYFIRWKGFSLLVVIRCSSKYGSNTTFLKYLPRFSRCMTNQLMENFLSLPRLERFSQYYPFLLTMQGWMIHVI